MRRCAGSGRGLPQTLLQYSMVRVKVYVLEYCHVYYVQPVFLSIIAICTILQY